VTEINEALEDAPEVVNEDPYGEGWLFKVKAGPTVSLGDLLNAKEYQGHCE
jgi:glycine cleavage system H protein